MGKNTFKFTPEQLWVLLQNQGIPLNESSPLFDFLLTCPFEQEKLDEKQILKELGALGLLPVPADLAAALSILTCPKYLFTLISRQAGKLCIGEFFGSKKKVVEFSYEDAIAYIHKPTRLESLNQSVSTLLNLEKLPEESPGLSEKHQFSLPEYIVLSAAFQLEEQSLLLGNIENIGSMTYTAADLVEQISAEGRFEIIDFMLGSEVESLDDFVNNLEDRVGENLSKLAKRDYLELHQAGVITLGRASRKLFSVLRQPTKVMLTASRCHYRKNAEMAIRTQSFISHQKSAYKIDIGDLEVVLERLYTAREVMDVLDNILTF